MHFWTSRERSSEMPISPTNGSINTANSNFSIYSFYRLPQDSLKSDKFSRSLNVKTFQWNSTSKENEEKESISKAKKRKSEILWKQVTSENKWKINATKPKRTTSQTGKRNNQTKIEFKNNKKPNWAPKTGEIGGNRKIRRQAEKKKTEDAQIKSHSDESFRVSFFDSPQQLTQKLEQMSLNCKDRHSQFKIHMLKANLSYRNRQYKDAYQNAQVALSKSFAFER